MKKNTTKKIVNFITNNIFTTATGDLIKKFQKDLRNNINECQLII